MNRREAFNRVGVGALVWAGKAASQSLPSSVAGVRIVDSEIAKAATGLSQAVSPPYLFNHAMRTFLLGSLTGRARGMKFDEGLLYLACILHDLGLTEPFAGELPFEIQGAQAALRFLRDRKYTAKKAEIVWDGIAMHPVRIGQFKRPEVALVGEGAGADVLGPDPSEIGKGSLGEILSAFPRLRFKTAFLDSCGDVVRRHPAAASQTFMSDVRDRYAPDFHSANFCDRVAKSPYSE
jgi:HD domain